ncbi:DNA mismatch repair endonuclease MutL [Paraferrimonas sp. SM1919]|uniref:DNA mismatch repair endonuclease MutL n=1 Tax=Paraferrimonas sp. SM1919 TaxID=2662263 RepID=UPI0013D7ABEF|nr:DNA mismatch repair endonuclease MutL [Paraferrimonas sp. SM1919]
MIRILSQQLANQIAAGEVVERPASIVKELVENSIDAGATRIDIDIARGGSKRIRVKDNGKGIPEDQLQLALARHATSKINALDDLDKIASFGFRGEALASISSVSRLTLSSRTAEQTQAWQAIAEGRDMQVKIQPCAHPVGTTIDVVDLFFNTPARRRFLKSEKTEFTHIDDWLKRAAFAKQDVHFTLRHNDKIIRQYRPALDPKQQLQRLTQVCGKAFADNALAIDCDHHDLHLSGFVEATPSSTSVNQFFYVNGRVVRDKLLNHGIKQAFSQRGIEAACGYVLALRLPAAEVDVNVHPAKHEVRFHQARIVHDFIVQALVSVLEQQSQLPSPAEQFDPETGEVWQAPEAEILTPSYITPLQTNSPSVSEDLTTAYSGGHRERNPYAVSPRAKVEQLDVAKAEGYQQLMQASYQAEIPQPSVPVLANRFFVLVDEAKLNLLAIADVATCVHYYQLQQQWPQGIIGQPLLLPVRMVAEQAWLELLEQHSSLLTQAGLEMSLHNNHIIVKKVPKLMKSTDIVHAITELFEQLVEQPKFDFCLWLAKLSVTIADPGQLWQQYKNLPESIQHECVAKAKPLPWQQLIFEAEH